MLRRRSGSGVMGCAECVFQKLYAEFSRLVDYVQNGLSKINIYIYIVFGLIYICICRVYLELLMRDNIYLNIPHAKGGFPLTCKHPTVQTSWEPLGTGIFFQKAPTIRCFKGPVTTRLEFQPPLLQWQLENPERSSCSSWMLESLSG